MSPVGMCKKSDGKEEEEKELCMLRKVCTEDPYGGEIRFVFLMSARAGGS